MSEANIELVRRAFESYNREDLDRIIASSHPDLEVLVPAELSAEPDTYRGHDGLRRYFDTFREAMSEIQFQPQRFWDVGDSVVVLLRVTAKGRHTTITVEQELAQVWTIRDGMALRVQGFAALADALQAAGISR